MCDTFVALGNATADSPPCKALSWTDNVAPGFDCNFPLFAASDKIEQYLKRG
jgi:hypothetical protein